MSGPKPKLKKKKGARALLCRDRSDEKDGQAIFENCPSRIELGTQDRLVLGRGGPNAVDVQIAIRKDAREIISRRHAEICRTPEGNFVLRDLGAMNGTFVNGTKIDMVVLKDGDLIQFGGLAKLNVGESFDTSDVNIRFRFHSITEGKHTLRLQKEKKLNEPLSEHHEQDKHSEIRSSTYSKSIDKVDNQDATEADTSDPQEQNIEGQQMKDPSRHSQPNNQVRQEEVEFSSNICFNKKLAPSSSVSKEKKSPAAAGGPSISSSKMGSPVAGTRETNQDELSNPGDSDGRFAVEIDFDGASAAWRAQKTDELRHQPSIFKVPSASFANSNPSVTTKDIPEPKESSEKMDDSYSVSGTELSTGKKSSIVNDSKGLFHNDFGSLICGEEGGTSETKKSKSRPGRQSSPLRLTSPTSLSPLLASLVTTFSCPLCSQLMLNPVVAPCSHAFCLPCVEKLSCNPDSSVQKCTVCVSKSLVKVSPLDSGNCHRSQTLTEAIEKLLSKLPPSDVHNYEERTKRLSNSSTVDQANQLNRVDRKRLRDDDPIDYHYEKKKFSDKNSLTIIPKSLQGALSHGDRKSQDRLNLW